MKTYTHGDTIPTIITTPDGVKLKGYLIAGRATSQTYSGRPGREWDLELALSEPSCRTFVWEDDTDVEAKAEAGFECGEWRGRLTEVMAYAERNHLVIRD